MRRGFHSAIENEGKVGRGGGVPQKGASGGRICFGYASLEKRRDKFVMVSSPIQLYNELLQTGSELRVNES